MLYEILVKHPVKSVLSQVITVIFFMGKTKTSLVGDKMFICRETCGILM